MKPTIVIFIFVLFFMCSESAKSQVKYPPDSLFAEIELDTLHVYTSMVQTALFGNLIPTENIENYPFYKKGISYYAINKFFIDKDKKFKAYLIKKDGNTYQAALIYLQVYQTDSAKLIFCDEIAVYQYMSAAFERTQNAWIADFNGDGDLDIGIYNNLIDFEMSTDNVPNTSGSKQYIYLLKNGKYEMRDWGLNILEKFPLVKGK